jgi:hypothetical protein
MQNFNVELFSRLFLLNLVKRFNTDEDFSVITDQAPSTVNQATLEPPTPPRTPTTSGIGHQQPRSVEKSYNNNNDDMKENLEGNVSYYRLSPTKLCSTGKSESDHEEYPRQMMQFNDDSYLSEEERGGRESIMSGLMRINGDGEEESEQEESDCASFDESKVSLKNIEHFLDKSPMVSLTTLSHNLSLFLT